MLEIENEKFENERRAKDQKISVLENQTSSLNEKFLILKMEFDEKQAKGQETEGRLKEELKDISEELVALKKKRNQIFIETLEHESQIRRNSILEQRANRKNSNKLSSIRSKDMESKKSKQCSKDFNRNGTNKSRTQDALGEETQAKMENTVSIRVIGSQENEDSKAVSKSNAIPSESSIKEANGDEVGLNRVGFGSTEKFEDKINSYNRQIYNNRLQRWFDRIPGI